MWYLFLSPNNAKPQRSILIKFICFIKTNPFCYKELAFNPKYKKNNIKASQLFFLKKIDTVDHMKLKARISKILTRNKFK